MRQGLHLRSTVRLGRDAIAQLPQSLLQGKLVGTVDKDDVTKDDVLAYLAGKVAKWQLPDDVLYVDSIPLTSTGKMDKKVVRADLDAKGYTLPDLRDQAG